MVAAIVLAAAGCLAQHPASAPIAIDFHDSASINDTVIRVDDVAGLTGGDGRCRERIGRVVLGEAAPAGFTRFMNTDEAVAVVRRMCPDAPIAGVKSGQRIQVRTRGREWRIADFADTIQTSLRDSIRWPAGDYVISLDSMAAHWKILDKPFTISVGGLKSGHPRGMIRLELTVSQGPRLKRIPFAALISVSTPVVVMRRTIGVDSIIGPADVDMVRREITHFAYEPFFDPREAIGKSATRTIQAGLILHANLLKRQPIVCKGDCLDVTVKRGAVRVSVTARARASGAKGDRIFVENIVSHKLIQVIIEDAGKAILPAEEAL
jgi:flagella basal body P-ring formation protein FlgA